MTANDTGWTTSTRSSVGAPGTCRTTSVSDQSTCGARASAHRAMCWANAGDTSSSSAPIPAHWEPWPGSTKTTLPSVSALPETTDVVGRPAASASRAARASSTSSATTTARCSSAARVVASACATSPSSSRGRFARCSARRAAWAARARPPRAETRRGRVPCPPPASPSRSLTRPASGTCSRMTWAFVPLTPNEDTADRRGRPVSGQSRASVSSSTAPDAQSTWGDGAST